MQRYLLNDACALISYDSLANLPQILATLPRTPGPPTAVQHTCSLHPLPPHQLPHHDSCAVPAVRHDDAICSLGHTPCAEPHDLLCCRLSTAAE